MSAGLMCLRCRHYIGKDASQPCECEDPIPSWDGKTPAVPPASLGIVARPRTFAVPIPGLTIYAAQFG